MKELKVGDRVLYRTANDQHVREGAVSAFSPNGKYVAFGYEWAAVADVNVMDELPPYPPGPAPQPLNLARYQDDHALTEKEVAQVRALLKEFHAPLTEVPLKEGEGVVTPAPADSPVTTVAA